MNKILQNMEKKLIVSCQAFDDSPLYGSDYMAKMAACAELGGACGIRACWSDNVRAIKKITKLPIIGINKVLNNGSLMDDKVFITPNFESAAEIIEAGTDILGMDCTARNRTYDEIGHLINKIKNNYPHILIMADISTLEEGIYAEKLGADIVSTTLSGYTSESRKALGINYDAEVKAFRETGKMPTALPPDFKLISDLKANVHIPINAEGRISNSAEAVKALECGAFVVTVGAAITAPISITRSFTVPMDQYVNAK
jgi:N-acylglucosamine-6-phosphate 2-epimerase